MTDVDTAPARRRLEPDARREQILAGARRLFAERGYATVSTTELAAEAGVTRGLINHYFGTKRGLYLEVIRQVVTAPETTMDMIATGTLPQRVDTIVGRLLTLILRHRRTWLATLGAEGFGRDPDVENILREADRITADRAIQTLALQVPDAERELLRTLIQAYAGLLRSTSVEWLVRRKLTRDQAHRLLADTLITLIETTFPALRAGRTLP